LEDLRARPMRSKPNPVDQPERTAHYDCAMCIAEMLHNTITQRQFCFPSSSTMKKLSTNNPALLESTFDALLFLFVCCHPFSRLKEIW